MSPEELKKHSKMIDDSVAFIERKTNEIWNKFEDIEGCNTDECDKERAGLKREMSEYIDKLKKEEKMIDQYEEILHNTGNEWTLYLNLERTLWGICNTLAVETGVNM